MAEQQRALVGSADLAAVDAAMSALVLSELTRGAAHASQLRSVLALARAQSAAGMELATVAQAALALGCSEHRAHRLLSEAQALIVLPGALEALDCGLLTVEQSATVVAQLAVLEPADQVAVWQRLQQRLIAENSTLPPARLSELLRRWVIAQDADAAERRRRDAEQSRGVDYRRREDGLYDLFGNGLTAPDAHAILSRIAARSRPWGVDDDRTADQRRLDAFRDLLLGRDQLPLQPLDQLMPAVCDGGSCPRCVLRTAGAAPCGCLPGQPVPCGAELSVLLPIGAGLGSTDEHAELVGHGPLEPDLTRQLLYNRPVLRPVWVDDNGVVVAVGDKAARVDSIESEAVRAALLALQDLPPPPAQPRHSLDHRQQPPPTDPPPPLPDPSPTAVQRRSSREPAAALRCVLLRTGGLTAADGRSLAAAALRETSDGSTSGAGAHPAGTPGGYRPPRWMRRLIDLRAPRCEWPGCGAKAVRCDAEHDVAWPDGPTCPCNLGPCCRRHHRIKQLGWSKTRSQQSTVTWTDPTGRTGRSASTHEPPATPVRPPVPIPTTSPLDELSPREVDDELWSLGLLPDDPGPWTVPRDIDSEPDIRDPLRHQLLHTNTDWTLDLADPHRWQPAEA